MYWKNHKPNNMVKIEYKLQHAQFTKQIVKSRATIYNFLNGF